MQIARRCHAQGLLQHQLARGGVEQVRPAHHIGDALRRIVDHHRQLVGPVAVGTAQHDIAHLGVHILGDAPLQRVLEACLGVRRHPQAHGPADAKWRHADVVDATHHGQLCAAATAFERRTGAQQPRQCRLVMRITVGLI